jgi:hypothetical protein
LKTV